MADAPDPKKGLYAFALLLDGHAGPDVKAWMASLVPTAVSVTQTGERQHCFIEGQRSLIHTLRNVTNKEKP